ncbi:MAG: SRPBCC domain-containing protein [Acidimicrobiia bacterium]
MPLFRKTKRLDFERSYDAPLDRVWQAWTDPGLLRRWWGPEHTTVTDCEIDLRVGGDIRVVMEAGEGMGKYQGTRWPMAGTFTVVDPEALLGYDARSWTEGEEANTTIEHANEVTFARVGGATRVRLTVTITRIGPKAKMAAFGMKWGYKAQLDSLGELLATTT